VFRVHADAIDYAMVSSGNPLTLKTRRPDLVPTDNVARCRQTHASSEEAGMYSEAAVDGSAATIWVPDDASGSVQVDLGRKLRISRITPHWTDAMPSTHQLLVSTDGTRWTPAPPADPSGTSSTSSTSGTSASTSPRRRTAPRPASASWK
jgi:F5/8 type C domain